MLSVLRRLKKLKAVFAEFKPSVSIIVLGFVAILSAGCSSENDGGQFGDPQLDSEPPIIESIEPEIENGVLVETDEIIQIEFNELLDVASINNGGIVLQRRDVSRTDDPFDDREQPTIPEGPLGLTVEEIVVPGVDPVTGADREQLATRVSIVPAEQELALGSTYELGIEQTLKDQSEIESVDPISGAETTGNFFAAAESRIIGTESGTWQAEQRQLVPGSLDTRDIHYASSLDSKAYAIWHEFDAGLNTSTLKSLAFDIIDPEFTALEAPFTPNLPTDIPLNPNADGSLLNTQGVGLDNDNVGVSWIQNNTASGVQALYFNFFDGTAWQSQAIQLSGANPVLDHLMIRLQNDEFVLAWIEDNAGTQTVFVNRLSPAEDIPSPVTGFDTAAWIAEADTAASSNTITFSSLTGASALNQRSVISWVQTQAGISTVSSILYNFASGIAQLATFSSEAGQDALNPSVSLSNAGDGYLTWQQFDSVRFNIWRTQIVGSRFGDAELVERNNLVDTRTPVVSVCRNGLATIMWHQIEGGLNNVYASFTLFDGSGWSAPQLVGPANFILNSVAINAQYDQSCNLIAIWSDSDAARSLNGAQFNVIEKVWTDSVTIGSFGLTSTDFNSVSLVPLRSGGRFMALYRRIFEGRFIPQFSLFNDSSD